MDGNRSPVYCDALGLIIVTCSKSEGQSSSISTLVAMPLAFLIGACMPMKTEMVTKFLPWGQAATSLRTLLNMGGQIGAVLPNMGIMTLEIVIIFAIGVILFSRIRLRSE